MKRFQKSILLVFFFVFFAGFVATAVYAQPLVPCGNADTIRSGGFLADECNVCHLQVLAMNVINFFVLITAVVAALLFVNAGVLYVMSSANPGNIAKAHRIFMTTLAGAVLVFAAWLLINTIMMSLVQGSHFLGWNNTLCTGNMEQSVITTPPSQVPPYSLPPNLPPNSGTTVNNEAIARAMIPGVQIWESAPGMTTLAGIQQTTIDGVNTIVSASGLPPSQLIITGAVDSASSAHNPGEKSHETGYKVDFEDTEGFNSYIEQNFTNTGTFREGDPVYTATINGRPVQAVKEGTHWDLKFE